MNGNLARGQKELRPTKFRRAGGHEGHSQFPTLTMPLLRGSRKRAMLGNSSFRLFQRCKRRRSGGLSFSVKEYFGFPSSSPCDFPTAHGIRNFVCTLAVSICAAQCLQSQTSRHNLMGFKKLKDCRLTCLMLYM